MQEKEQSAEPCTSIIIGVQNDANGTKKLDEGTSSGNVGDVVKNGIGVIIPNG